MSSICAVLFAIVAGAGALATPGGAMASTVETVKERGYVKCGVTRRYQGFSEMKEDQWVGFNVDFCRAVASAVLGDRDAVKHLPFWVDALAAGEVDVLIAGSTWTLTRETKEGVQFTGTNFYDGQGFLVHKSLNVESLADVKKASVCAVAPTATTASNLQDYITLNKLDWTVMGFETLEGVWSSFVGRRCDMMSHDRSALAGMHIGRMSNPDDYLVLPEVISKEPLSPAVRKDDAQWYDIVRWATFATIAAEEFGITSANVDGFLDSPVPEIRRLLGVEGGLGPTLGLDDKWAYRIIKQVGNYGEIFDRNLGPGSPYKLSRGLNALWKDGGLLYAPPFR